MDATAAQAAAEQEILTARTAQAVLTRAAAAGAVKNKNGAPKRRPVCRKGYYSIASEKRYYYFFYCFHLVNIYSLGLFYVSLGAGDIYI